MTQAEPAWLSAWKQRESTQPTPVLAKLAEQGQSRGNGGTSANSATAPALLACAPAPVLVPVARVMEVTKHKPGVDWTGFEVPGMWAWDGGRRREKVLDHDHNPPRFVRHVGWRTCMKCCEPYFSQDVIRLRLCDGCKATAPKRDWSKKTPLQVSHAPSGGPG